jgi:plasmid maintenance system antidote protein VapI
MAALATKIETANRTHLSRELGVDRSYLSNVLNGKRHQGMSLGLALRLSRVFGATVEELSRVLDAKGAVN